MADKSAASKPKVDAGDSVARESRARTDAPVRLPVSAQLPGLLQLSELDPASLGPADLQMVQSVVGMRAVRRMLAGSARNTRSAAQCTADPRASLQRMLRSRNAVIQTRLTVGAADDPYEREAERVAAQALSGNAPGMTRQDGEPDAQRMAGATDLSGSFEAGDDVERQLAAGGGSQLPARLRSDLEPRFGADFGNVRIHTGAASDQLNRRLGAQAFTHGNHIYMAAGKYNPGTAAGRHLLAHELTHTVQQGAAPLRRKEAPAQRGAAKRIARRMAAGLIQRFRYDDKPAPDLAPPNGATWLKKSSGGKNGAYFARKGGEHVVIKFQTMDETMMSEYGNMAFREGAKMKAPETRVHKKGTPGYAQVAAGILYWKANPVAGDNRIVAEAQSDIDNNHAVVLMERLQGDTLEDLARDQSRHTDLMNALLNSGVQRGLAKLLVMDSLLGNSDRIITESGTNPGNVFIGAGGTSVYALDNAAERLGSAPNEQALKSKSLMLMDLTSAGGLDTAVDYLFRGILLSTPVAYRDFLAGWLHTQGPAIRNNIINYVQQEYKEILGNMKSNKSSMKKQHQRITGEFASQGGSMPNWDTFRSKAKLLELRTKGMQEAEALRAAFAHNQYKQSKTAGGLGYQKIPLMKYLWK